MTPETAREIFRRALPARRFFRRGWPTYVVLSRSQFYALTDTGILPDRWTRLDPLSSIRRPLDRSAVILEVPPVCTAQWTSDDWHSTASDCWYAIQTPPEGR